MKMISPIRSVRNLNNIFVMKKNSLIAVTFFLLCISCESPRETTVVNDLRVEYMKNPVGIDVNQPRFSWKMESREKGVSQKAYTIMVSTDESFKTIFWSSDEVLSDKSVHIVYSGPALKPATRYFWKVQVKDQDSKYLLSKEKAFFETGLMDSGWSSAQWIKPNEEDTKRMAPMFRTTCKLNKRISSARIYTSGLGIYEVFINGKRIGAPDERGGREYEEFKPGWTDYTATVFYSTCDVKDLLKQGENVIGAIVASGWWKGDIAFGKYGNPDLGFIAKLVVNYTDGTSETIVTDPKTWKYSLDGPILYSDIYHGEVYDARKESAWTNSGFNDS